MDNDMFVKAPAFFPTAQAEIFFEAESGGTVSFFADAELDAELDAMLSDA